MLLIFFLRSSVFYLAVTLKVIRLPGERVQDHLDLLLLPLELFGVRNLPEGCDNIGELDAEGFVLTAVASLGWTFGCWLSSVLLSFLLALPEEGVGFRLGQFNTQDFPLPVDTVDQLHGIVPVLLHSYTTTEHAAFN